MLSPVIRLTLLAIAVSVAGTVAVGQAITFRKIADESTPIPGGPGMFTYLPANPAPAIDDGHVAFLGVGSDAGRHFAGVYTDLGGTLRAVADTNTVVPGGTETFASVLSPDISGNRIAFQGIGSQGDGIYLERDGVLSMVANRDTPVPGVDANFSIFFLNALTAPSIDRDQVAFAAFYGGGFGVFVTRAGRLTAAATTMTTPPDRTVLFSSVGGAAVHGGAVAFLGAWRDLDSGSGRGIYLERRGQLITIVDSDMPVPEGVGNFDFIGFPSLNRGEVAFQARDQDLNRGLYHYRNGKLRRRVGGLEPTPGGPPAFGPHAPSLDNGRLLFTVAGGGVLWLMHGQDELIRVISRGDTLDGRVVNSILVGKRALSGDQAVFTAWFGPGAGPITTGVFVATIPGTCGDGRRDPGEVCDDGAGNGQGEGLCVSDCTGVQQCGDGVTNGNEGCDDGNTAGSDACPADCDPWTKPAISVPTVSQWGMVAMILVMLTLGRVLFRRRNMHA